MQLEELFEAHKYITLVVTLYSNTALSKPVRHVFVLLLQLLDLLLASMSARNLAY